MARSPRSHAPGAVFHLTARTQGHEPWFTAPIRDRICVFAADAIRRSDARLLAYAIMPSHLHLLIQQGTWRLGKVMHPLLLRTALLVNGVRGTQGHVFERRFGDVLCGDPLYVRTTISYINLNPPRAGLVKDPNDYRCSSHRVYLGATGALSDLDRLVDRDVGLRLFCHDHVGTPEKAYQECIDWRLARDAWLIANDAGPDAGSPPRNPPSPSAATDWARSYPPLFADGRAGTRGAVMTDEAKERQLHDIVLEAMADAAGVDAVTLDQVRSRCRKPLALRIRREAVRRMSDAGHSGTAIARYLRVSDQCISHILAWWRRRR